MTNTTEADITLARQIATAAWCDGTAKAAEIVAEVRAQAREAAIEEAAKVCEQMAQDFLSPEYATGQPFSSFHERFARGRCITNIRALSAQRLSQRVEGQPAPDVASGLTPPLSEAPGAKYGTSQREGGEV